MKTVLVKFEGPSTWILYISYKWFVLLPMSVSSCILVKSVFLSKLEFKTKPKIQAKHYFDLI